MHTILFRSLGFFLASSLPIVYWHWEKLPIQAEIIDGVVSAFVFSLPFMFGSWLGAKGMKVQGSEDRGFQFLWGVSLAVILWGAVWAFWTNVPESIHTSLGVWALGLHMALAFFWGVMGSRLPIFRQNLSYN